jgi:hypothetical protein
MERRRSSSPVRIPRWNLSSGTMAAADTLPRVTVLCLAASLTGALALAALVRCGGECEVAGETMEQALTATWRGDADALRGALDADPALAEGSVCLPEEGLSGRPSVDFSALGGFSSLLHVAARQGHADIVGILLAYGTDPDGDNPLGQTPLHLAAMYGHTAAAESLLMGGANVDARARGGYTPLALAAGHGWTEVL